MNLGDAGKPLVRQLGTCDDRRISDVNSGLNKKQLQKPGSPVEAGIISRPYINGD